jgi:hypothetical protein
LPTILNAKLLPFLALSKTQRLKQEKEKSFFKANKVYKQTPVFYYKENIKRKKKKEILSLMYFLSFTKVFLF